MLNNIEKIYKHLHQYPELSYKEFETTKYIVKYLEKYDLKIFKLDPTGLIAVLDKGNRETIAFRADMDAMPIKEANDFDYKSKNSNVMHACGHDGHMTMLLQFIINIFENNLKFDRNLMFIFQPAEEVDGGARIVLKSEAFKSYNVTKIFGTHLWPEIKRGSIGVKYNELMGTNFVFEIKIEGKSAHISTPQNGIDTCQAFAEIVQNINYIIAKTTGPFEPAVINIGKVQGGVASNVIMDEMIVQGGVRASNDETLAKVVSEFEKVLSAIEVKFGTKIELIQKEITYPTVVNDTKIVNTVLEVLNNNENFEVTMLDNPTLACEDFGFYCKKIESMFFFLGTFDRQHTGVLHSPNFCFDIEVLTKGVMLYEELLKIYG